MSATWIHSLTPMATKELLLRRFRYSLQLHWKRTTIGFQRVTFPVSNCYLGRPSLSFGESLDFLRFCENPIYLVALLPAPKLPLGIAETISLQTKWQLWWRRTSKTESIPNWWFAIRKPRWIPISLLLHQIPPKLALPQIFGAIQYIEIADSSPPSGGRNCFEGLSWSFCWREPIEEFYECWMGLAANAYSEAAVDEDVDRRSSPFFGCLLTSPKNWQKLPISFEFDQSIGEQKDKSLATSLVLSMDLSLVVSPNSCSFGWQGVCSTTPRGMSTGILFGAVWKNGDWFPCHSQNRSTLGIYDKKPSEKFNGRLLSVFAE